MVNHGSGDDEQDFPSTLPGTVIAGKYRLDGMIGRGGMGSVWSTMHLGLGQRVAVKLIAKRYASSREARQRFDLEAKAAAQLRSRYVVQVFDNGETEDGTPYIVMELLDGESLDHRIERRGPVPLDQTLRIVGQVGRALIRAHGLGIIHRDLKPENIFLTRSDEDDGSEIAKVLDFGIAKIKTSDTSSSATRTGTVLGTPLFMSPEQARGLKSVDHRTDLYSLGMVTFTMLTGRNAFSGESFGDILVAICTQPLPSLRTHAALLPPTLDAWMQRACAKEPGDRFPSVELMLDALYAAAGMVRPRMGTPDAMATNQPSQVRAPGTGSQGGVPATHIMTQASGGLSGQRSPPGASDQRTMEALAVSGEDIPKRSMMPVVLIGLAALALGGAGAFVALREPIGPAPAAKGEGGAPTLATSVAAPTATPSATAAAPPPPKSSASEPSKPNDTSVSAAPKATAVQKPPGPAAAPARPPEPPKPVPVPAPKPSNPRPKTPDLGF
jgi:eukaryotic-like serine/threonine-protein kinase